MNEPIKTLATLKEYDRVSLGGYDWSVWVMRNERSLHPIGDKCLEGCEISEVPGKGGVKPTFTVKIDHPNLRMLTARCVAFTSLDEAVTWAECFQWATRQAGSLTWVAESADSDRWHARIGISNAEIFQHEHLHGSTFTVTRHMRLGNQGIEFKITDLAFGKDETKNIESFAQASAIALTMTDYVMELMRNAESTD